MRICECIYWYTESGPVPFCAARVDTFCVQPTELDSDFRYYCCLFFVAYTQLSVVIWQIDFLLVVIDLFDYIISTGWIEHFSRSHPFLYTYYSIQSL